MERINIALEHPDFPTPLLQESVIQLLHENELGALATVRNDGAAHVNTAYLVPSENLMLYFLSQPSDVHIENISHNPSVAAAIWEQAQRWGEDLFGVQIFGRAERVGPGPELAAAMSLFFRRFPAFKSVMRDPGKFAEGVSSRMYVVRPESLKLLDERRFGRRNYLNITI